MHQELPREAQHAGHRSNQRALKVLADYCSSKRGDFYRRDRRGYRATWDLSRPEIRGVWA